MTERNDLQARPNSVEQGRTRRAVSRDRLRASIQGSAQLEGACVRIATGTLDLDARLSRILRS